MIQDDKKVSYWDIKGQSGQISSFNPENVRNHTRLTKCCIYDML